MSAALVDDLQAIVVDVALVDEIHIASGPVVALEDLNVILLQPRRLLDDAVVYARHAGREESLTVTAS